MRASRTCRFIQTYRYRTRIENSGDTEQLEILTHTADFAAAFNRASRYS